MKLTILANTVTGLLLSLGIIAGCDRQPESKPTTAATNALCDAHKLPTAECPFCNEKLVSQKGMCAEHGVPEALCWNCDKRLVAAFKAKNDWCAGHERPESFCYICNPELQPTETAAGSSTSQAAHPSLGVAVETESDSDTPRRMRDPSVTCATSKTKVQLASLAIAQSAGLETTPVQRRPMSQTLQCNAEIVYDGNHFARVSCRVPGVVFEVKKDVGAKVEKGDTLALVDSSELASSKAEYLQSVGTVALWDQNHQRTHELVEKGIAGKQEDLEAETKLAESRIVLSKAAQKLKTLGLTAQQVDEVARNQDTSPMLPIAAPFAGIVVERGAVIGETVDTSKTLFAVADTRMMWAHLDLYEGDIGLAKIGQPVIVRVDGLRGESYAGALSWISTQVDSKTRTLRVRAELNNEDGALKANMFGRATITTHHRVPLVVIPKSALQWDGCCNIAFVKVSELIYEPRQLRLGIEAEDLFEVKEGLNEGDMVVTQGSFMLKTEIMKSSIGAGCCEHGGPKKS